MIQKYQNKCIYNYPFLQSEKFSFLILWLEENYPNKEFIIEPFVLNLSGGNTLDITDTNKYILTKSCQGSDISFKNVEDLTNVLQPLGSATYSLADVYVPRQKFYDYRRNIFIHCYLLTFL